MVIVFIQKFSMGQVFISFMPVRPLAGETCFTWNNDLIFPVFYQNSIIFQAILKENSPQRHNFTVSFINNTNIVIHTLLKNPCIYG